MGFQAVCFFQCSTSPPWTGPAELCIQNFLQIAEAGSGPFDKTHKAIGRSPEIY